ncbi:class I SAM-dependent RNA methyltransferase [Thermodesulfobacteriota bacterium]
MINYSPLKKRIKRHVIGPSHTFFAATSSGLENLCEKELLSLFPESKELSAFNGGVEFKGKLDDCYKANLYLRTPGRILMRITEFNASNFRRLHKKLQEIAWELYLHSNVLPKINVTAKHSRLYHKDAIADRFITSINERIKSNTFLPLGNGREVQHQQIFVRVIDDRFTVSLDSSGELLYKRGIKGHGGKAPLRETLASAALMIAGYRSDEPLLDPMCGTGTFSIEAGMISNRIPPGWYRNFAFENWPGFRPELWNYIKKVAQKSIVFHEDLPNIIACDKDRNTCATVKRTVKKYQLSNNIKILNRDFFTITPIDVFGYTQLKKPGLVIINPPYGIRIGTKKNSKRLINRIIRRLKQHYSGWKAALFIHGKKLPDIRLSEDSIITVDHGGLKLLLYTGKITGGNNGQ